MPSFFPLRPQLTPHTVQVVQVAFSIENGISTVQNVLSSTLRLGDGQVKDLKFSDDQTLLVLWESKGK